MTVAEMGVVLYAANEGFLQDIEVEKILDFESALMSYMNSEEASFIEQINKEAAYSDEVLNKMHQSIEKFKNTQTW